MPLTATAMIPAEWSGEHVEAGVLVHGPATAIGGFASTVVAGTSPSEGEVARISATTTDGGVTLKNAELSVEIGPDGTVHRVFDKRANREVLAERGNQLWAYVDRPRSWDAWDIDETYENAGMEIDSIEIVEEGPLRAAMGVTCSWRSSRVVQTYRLLSGSSRIDIDTQIDWHERLMLVRALFPTTVQSHEATFEAMFGVQRRSTHRNTTWERARFEAGAHRFVDLSQPGYGVALLNDAKYDHSALGISLVLGPLRPDPFTDEGEHQFTYSLFPHVGDWVNGGVTREAKALNAPLVITAAGSDAWDREAFVASIGVELGLGALKRAHDRDGIVLRVYEPHGSRGRAELAFADVPPGP